MLLIIKIKHQSKLEKKLLNYTINTIDLDQGILIVLTLVFLYDLPSELYILWHLSALPKSSAQWSSSHPLACNQKGLPQAYEVKVVPISILVKFFHL